MKKTGGYIFVILSSIGFGLSPLLASFVTAYGVGSIMMTFMNTIFLIPLFLILCLAAKKPLSISRKQFCSIFILALSDSVLTTTFLFSSYQHLDGGTATSLNFTFPVFVIIFGMLFYKEKPSRQVFISFLFCTAGVLFFCSPSGNFTWKGFTLALLSGVFYGFYVLYLDKSGILEEMGYLSFTFWMMLISSVILLPVTILFGQFSFAIPPAGWLFSLLFALDTGFVAVVFLEIGIVRIGSMRASILGAVEPITSIAAGAIFLNESVTVQVVCGCILILISVFILVEEGNRITEES